MRRVVRVAVCFVIALAGITAAAAPAGADTHGYSITAYWQSDFGCVQAKATGSTDYTTTGYLSQYGQWVTRYQNPVLVAPKITVALFDKCVRGRPGNSVNATGMDLVQLWYYNNCSLNPSIGVAAPWSVGVYVTPTCGNKSAARRSTRYEVTAHSYSQSNSATRATWHASYDTTIEVHNKLCLHGSVGVTVYKSNRSDSANVDLGYVCAVR